LNSHLGYGYAMNNRIADADREYAAAVSAFKALGRADSAAAVVTLNNWARVSWVAGDTRHALELIDETIGLAVAAARPTSSPRMQQAIGLWRCWRWAATPKRSRRPTSRSSSLTRRTPWTANFAH